MAALPAQRAERAERAVWRRVSPAPGLVLDLLHARMTEPYAPHVHEVFSVGACTEGREVISYRGELHYATPGSVVILEPDEPHTGGPAPAAKFRLPGDVPGRGAAVRDDRRPGDAAVPRADRRRPAGSRPN